MKTKCQYLESPQALLDCVRPGDVVTIRTPQGQERKGRAVIVTYAPATVSHVALNMGGRHGTPGVATSSNIVEVRKRAGRNA